MDQEDISCEAKRLETSEVMSENEENSVEIRNKLPAVNEVDNAEISKAENEGWLDIMGSGTFKKKVIKPGLENEPRPKPKDRAVVDIFYYVNNTLFETSKDLKFIVGDLDVLQGIDLVICLMAKGEKAKVIIPSKLAYGTVGRLPDVPPDSEIECEIELKDIELFDENALSVSERLQLGDEKRSRGNFFYDRAQYLDSLHCYERAEDYLDLYGGQDCSDSSPEELQELVNMRLKVYNNMAATHLKLSAYNAALKSLECVLKVQPKNVKALFRKGKILGLQGSTDEAIVCMKAASELEPETKVIQTELIKLRNQKKREEQTQKAMYRRMFKSEPKKSSRTWIGKWSMISCGVLAVAVGSAFAYRNFHT